MKAPIAFENRQETANNSCFVKEQHSFYALFYRQVFPCQPSCANWNMSKNSTILARSGRARTNLHNLLCYRVTKYNSLHGRIINTKSNTGSFRATLCTVNLNSCLKAFEAHDCQMSYQPATLICKWRLVAVLSTQKLKN
jgi:hypothetical protein